MTLMFWHTVLSLVFEAGLNAFAEVPDRITNYGDSALRITVTVHLIVAPGQAVDFSAPRQIGSTARRQPSVLAHVYPVLR